MTTTTLKSVATGDPARAPKDPVVTAITGALSKMTTILPAHITAEKMARLAMGELRLNPKLAAAAKANPASLVASMMKASQAGLEIGGSKGHGYLVPFKGEVTFMPGYRGLIQLARQSGMVTSISVHIAYMNDKFDMVLGIDEKITHEPRLDGDRGAPRLVYGVARFTDGSHHFDWMPMNEVDRLMKMSQSKGEYGPWKDHKPEMIRKTMIRRLTKYLPMSSDRLEAAVDASDAFDDGQTIDVDWTVTDDSGAPPAPDAPPAPAAPAEAPTAIVGEEVAAPAAKGGGAPAVTYAQLREDMERATNLDDLDAIAGLIPTIGPRAQAKELNEIYAARRTALGGN